MAWTGIEYALLAAALAATHADIQSTKAFLRSGDGNEANPLLGEHPSDATLNAAGVTAALGGILAANALPDQYRRGFLGAWAGLEARLAYQNRDPKDGPAFADVMKKPAVAALACGLLAHYGLPVEVGPTPDGRGLEVGVSLAF